MDSLKLNDAEQKHYEELFQICDLSKTAKVPKVIVGELLATSGLTKDTLLMIADMCGASRLGYFGRSQFYIALKLIAATQNQLPLSMECCANYLPLPVFNVTGLSAKLATFDLAQCTVSEVPTTPQILMINPGLGGGLPPPPTKKHVRNMSGTSAPQVGAVLVLPASAPSQQPSTNDTNPSNQKAGWAAFPENSADNSPAVNEEDETQQPHTPTAAAPSATEQSHPLGWNYGGSKKSNIDTISLSSADYATSEAESVDDVWSITDEQRQYYIDQFKSLQPDLSRNIKGPKAKEFFEKSRLKTSELSKIWKLSDIGKDGELSLEEFCTAMHLVVLRRNDIELPNELPATLVPYTPSSSEPFGSDLPGHGEKDSIKSVSPPPTQTKPTWKPQISAPAGSVTLETQTSVVSSTGGWEDSSNNSPVQPQWTGSSVTSKTLVNFDGQPPYCDQEVLHPVAMKISPNSGNQMIENLELRSHADSDPHVYDAVQTVQTRNRSNTDTGTPSINSSIPAVLQSRPRPTPKKAQSTPCAQNEPQTVHQPMNQSLPQTVVGVPPRVPPRQWSNSPDITADPFNPLSADTDPFILANSQTRSEGDGLAFPTNFSTEFPQTFDDAPFAANVKRGEQTALQPAITPQVSRTSHQYSLRDKREILASIKSQRERNDALVRINSELNQELQEVMEQRISLEIQLEHLKPC